MIVPDHWLAAFVVGCLAEACIVTFARPITKMAGLYPKEEMAVPKQWLWATTCCSSKYRWLVFDTQLFLCRQSVLLQLHI